MEYSTLQTLKDKERCERTDRLFEIGLVLATILAAAELQYSSVRFYAPGQLGEVNFVFRVTTIPIAILVMLWLIKELTPTTLEGHLPLRKWVKEFCWTFLGNFIVLDMLLFIILSFYPDVIVLSSWVMIMAIVSFVLTFPVTWQYNKCDEGEGEKPTKWSIFVEHVSLTIAAYVVLQLIVWWMGNIQTPN